MKPLDYDQLEQTYQVVKQGNLEPNQAYMSLGAYNAIREYLSKKAEADDYDDFDGWVKDVREKAKEPRNRHLRRFLELGPCRKRPTKLTKPRYARFHK